jgi:hypothetical protein
MAGLEFSPGQHKIMVESRYGRSEIWVDDEFRMFEDEEHSFEENITLVDKELSVLGSEECSECNTMKDKGWPCWNCGAEPSEPSEYLTFEAEFKPLAQHKGEPRQRTNIDTPTEMPELWEDDVEDEILDPAERCREDLYGIGSEVVLEEDIQARERGGGHLIVPSGERGKVLKDMEGDGKMLYVQFPEMCVTMAVPKRMLRSAALKKVTAQSMPEYVNDTYMMVAYFGDYVVGASTSIRDSEDEMNSNGMVYYDGQAWQPWSNDEGSRKGAERLNADGWQLFITRDSFKIDDDIASWSKIGKKAATVDQIQNEIKAMLREGYGEIDIKDAINLRYPEHADEVLSSFDAR